MRMIQAVFLGLVPLLVAIRASAQTPNGPSAQRSTTATVAPRWGIQDPSIETLYAWDFQPADDQMVFGITSPGSYLRYCVSSVAPYDPLGYLEAPVHLPTGVLIDKIEMATCDTDDNADAVAALYYVPYQAFTSTVMGTATSAGSTGCFYNQSGSIGHTVDNS